MLDYFYVETTGIIILHSGPQLTSEEGYHIYKIHIFPDSIGLISEWTTIDLLA